jgi:citrate synthase
VLQAAVAALAADDRRPNDPSQEAMRERAIDLVGKMAAITAAWHRLRRGLEALPADPGLGHAADFLRMLLGRDLDPAAARDLDVALILHADHSLNASTFVARAAASTRAHLYACLSAALGALSGELHGGANSRVMQMLEAIGSPSAVEAYVAGRFDRHEPVMGMGHAVYHTADPRALILQAMARRAGERTGDPTWYDLTLRVQETTQRLFRERKGAEIYPNVDMYSASLYHALGIPGDLFTPVFAVSRVAGWSAHVIEERFAEAMEKPALYRPQSDYVGQYCGPESCAYVPLAERSETAPA